MSAHVLAVALSVNGHGCASSCARNTTPPPLTPRQCVPRVCQYKSYLNFLRHSYVLHYQRIFSSSTNYFYSAFCCRFSSFCVLCFAFVDFVNLTIVAFCSRAHIPAYPVLLFACLLVCRLPFVAAARHSPLAPYVVSFLVMLLICA